MWSLVSVSSAARPAGAAAASSAERSDRSVADGRERGDIRVVSGALLAPTVPVVPEIHHDEKVRALGRSRVHAGKRDDRQDFRQVTRSEREALTLETIGVFRVVSRRSIVDACFDGHPFAANRVIAGLERKGLLRCETVSRPPKRGKDGKERPAPSGANYGYTVLTLTGAGRDLVARRRRDPSKSAKRVVAADDQRFWQGLADIRQLRHDHQVFDAVAQEARELEAKNCHIRKVRLEPELRGLLASAEHFGRKADGEAGAVAGRCKAAQDVGLRVFQARVPLPDALIEVEHADGSISSRSIEVTSSHYTSVQVAQKRDAGFRNYGWRSGKNKGGALTDSQEFPLAWGR